MKSGHAWRNVEGGERGEHDVACHTFLARHSDWIDGELTDAEAAAHERHLDECTACARYARVLERGADVLRRLPEIEPSADFEARLQHRLFHLEDEAAFAGGGNGLGRWLGAAAVFGIAASAVFMVASGPALLARLDALAPSPSADPVPGVHPHEAVFAPTLPIFEPAVVPGAFAGGDVRISAPAYTPVVIRAPQYRATGASAVVGD